MLPQQQRPGYKGVSSTTQAKVPFGKLCSRHLAAVLSCTFWCREARRGQHAAQRQAVRQQTLAIKASAAAAAEDAKMAQFRCGIDLAM